MENKFDFNKNLEFLINTTVDTSKAVEQDKILNSKDYNNTFQMIEDSLNLLYEKTRTIQNLIDYSNSFIKNEIDETITECKSLLDSIENNRDLMKDSAYINYNVKLQSIFDTYADRNNSPIKGVEMHNGVITLNNNIIEEIEFNNIVVESKNSTNNILNTASDIIFDRNYRTFYMFDRTQKNSIQEKITIHLGKVKTINKINLIPSNCIIKSIELTLEDNSVEVIKGYDINLIRNRNVKNITINIECKNYMISQINYNEVEDKNFWDLIEEIKNDENLTVDKDKYYYYLFGLDKISIQYTEPESKSCFISKEIKVDNLKNNEYLSLAADYNCEAGNIEFYIIDGTNEIPILPEGESEVIQEQIFYKVASRFTVDDISTIKVYKNGILTKTSLNEAINSTDEGYTVSYVPKDASSVSGILNDTIKVKAIIRNYDSNYIPFIKSIQIKKYGGGSLWIDQVQI